MNADDLGGFYEGPTGLSQPDRLVSNVCWARGPMLQASQLFMSTGYHNRADLVAGLKVVWFWSV